MGKLAEQLALMAMRGLSPRVAEIRRNTLGHIVAGVLFATAYVAVIVASWFFLTPEVGPAWAALIVAGVAILVGLLVLAWVAIANRRAERLALIRRASLTADPLSSGLAAELPGMLRDNPITTVALVSGFAYLLARNHGFGRPPKQD
ncbi:hypothetical protein HFC70_23110 [Agrobacterium sp. a22-2]|uniref:hypothetical protein n=1 Tax=Agrobacterium sp. a22-2 TaxID=2283840 RepID=UPI001444B4AB|nr:hypothetical protein [Agrobacterium sp. a22-2]NKN39237.1 hypothetical protein [Agrobacterium sp. a22-2]